MLHYKPCRVSELYFDINGEIIVRSFETDVYRFRDASRTIWLMLDGKNSIKTIVNKLCDELCIDDFDGIYNDLLVILNKLQLNSLVVADWDPLFKTELRQELFLHE